jgi:hypothetical protein
MSKLSELSELSKSSELNELSELSEYGVLDKHLQMGSCPALYLPSLCQYASSPPYCSICLTLRNHHHPHA